MKKITGRKFRVKGNCLVPFEVEIVIEGAESEEDAVKRALSLKWQDWVDGNAGDFSAAFDWQPTAEEVQP